MSSLTTSLPAATDAAAPALPSMRRPRGANGWLRALLGVPMYQKIVLANASLTLAAVVAVAVCLNREPIGTPVSDGLLVAVASLVLAGGILVNGRLVWIALSPLRELERAAARVRAGDLSARAASSPVADAELRRLVALFNDMLERLARQRAFHRALTAQAQEAAGRERKRLADELNADIAQRLAALLLRLQAIRKERDPARCEEKLEDLRTDVAATLEAVRDAARRLHPPELEEIGLTSAVRAMLRRLGERSGLHVELEAGDVDGWLSVEARAALFRILEEALHNVRAHAESSRVTVRLWREGATVHALVADDGRGFDPEGPAGNGSGLGLFSMRERATHFGGLVSVQSGPAGGTRIHVELPARAG